MVASAEPMGGWSTPFATSSRRLPSPLVEPAKYTDPSSGFDFLGWADRTVGTYRQVTTFLSSRGLARWTWRAMSGRGRPITAACTLPEGKPRRIPPVRRRGNSKWLGVAPSGARQTASTLPTVSPPLGPTAFPTLVFGGPPVHQVARSIRRHVGPCHAQTPLPAHPGAGRPRTWTPIGAP